MPETKQWTLMFYFASDNPLAISVVSQLKALKAAGFHHDVNVVTQFDPYTQGTPTHVFDVNLVNKLKAKRKGAGDNIGFCETVPVVRSLIEDKLWRDERTGGTDDPIAIAAGEDPDGELIRTALQGILGDDYNPPLAPFTTNGFSDEHDHDEPDPDISLREFLRFCARDYPAKRYMLFMLGHGVVVGNDIFMLDEHAASRNSLTLTELRSILLDFKARIGKSSKFELVSFHSCSVSSVEVAYELLGTANYTLSSQGPTFVGSWPYRQILIRFFHEVDQHGDNINVRDLLLHIYNYCLLNSADYLLAGYSFQLTLCDLTKIARLATPLSNLTRALIAGLGDLTSRDYILLSHWKSQSFFNEMYTDLYDFCFCFVKKVEELRRDRGRVTFELRSIEAACNEVMDVLVKENPKRAGDPVMEQTIVAADSLGPAYQYSRGLSIYFPWSEPSHDRRILAEYEKYQFTTLFRVPWLAFLQAYFTETMREVSKTEADPRRFLPLLNAGDTLDEDIASLVYGGSEGTLSGSLGGLPPMLKGDPTDKTGGDLEAVSIKNYPRDVRSRRSRRNKADFKFPLAEAFTVFDRRNGSS